MSLYAHRVMLEEEFEKIWSEQARHHSILNGDATDAINASGDVVLGDLYGKASLAYNGSTSVSKQLIKVTDLVPDVDSKSLLINNSFAVRDLNDRDSTGFGQLLGQVQSTQSDGSIRVIGVVLTPYTP